MLPESARRIANQVPDDAVVLDIGGWARPFRRADWVIDIMPFESRGLFGHEGDPPERFTADRWIVHDLSSNVRLPFEDGQFDFVVCSHTLEDIRDPIHLCAEINRVGKAGYVEVPSRRIESTYGIEGAYAGYYHHRWLVEIMDGEVVFRFKPHLLHGSRRFHLPARSAVDLPEAARVTYTFWEGSFGYREVIQLSDVAVRSELAAFAESHVPLAPWERLQVRLPRTRLEARQALRRSRLGQALRGRAEDPAVPEIEIVSR